MPTYTNTYTKVWWDGGSISQKGQKGQSASVKQDKKVRFQQPTLCFQILNKKCPLPFPCFTLCLPDQQYQQSWHMNIFIAYCSPLSWYFPSHGCCVLPWCPIFPGFAPISDGSVYKLIIYREQGWEYRSTIYRAIDNCIVFTILWSIESSISIDNIFWKCFMVLTIVCSQNYLHNCPSQVLLMYYVS